MFYLLFTEEFLMKLFTSVPRHWKMWIVLFLVPYFIIEPIHSQIVDTNNVILYEDPGKMESLRPTYFGYTVLLYATNGISWLVAAAPRSNSSSMVNVNEPGGVYKCGFKELCKPLFLDDKITRKLENKINEEKNGSWLGMSMAANPKSDIIAVCAPRRYFIKDDDQKYMEGSCYATNLNWNNTDNELAPHLTPLNGTKYLVTSILRYKIDRTFYYGMGLVGFSSHFSKIKNSKNKSNLVLGAPGLASFEGVALSLKLKYGSSRIRHGDFHETIIPSVLRDTIFKQEDYLGYSITSGNFYGEESLFHVAAAPRSKNLLGKVAIYKFQLNDYKPNFKQFLIGDQEGSYFGASLAAADFNGDGYDDLLVGAPYDTTPKVHIYLGNERELSPPKESGTRFLKMSQWEKFSCFGISLATVDFNHDGFTDAIVGAPETNGVGAIAIFMGKSSGLEVSPIQVIYGKDVYEGIRGFGISLSPPVDIDQNTYPDIAVGSYKSGHVAVFRGIPEAHLKASLETIQIVVNGTIKVKACLDYYWNDTYPARRTIDVHRKIIVDSTFDSYPRATLVGATGIGNEYKQTKTIAAFTPWCEELVIKLETSIEYLIPFEITLIGAKNGNVKNRPSLITAHNVDDADKFDKLDPRIIDNEEGTATISIPLYTNCGDDNKCSSDLSVTARFPDYMHKNFILGLLDTVILEVVVINKNESAYSTEIKINLPLDATLARLPTTCRIDGVSHMCKVDNPLPSGHNKTIYLEIDMKSISETILKSETIKFRVEAITQSIEINYADNIAEALLPLALDSRIAVAGKLPSDNNDYIASDDGEYEMVEFKHLYEIQKFGPSNVEEVLLEIYIPNKYRKHDSEIEFLRTYEPVGFQNGQPITCERTDYIYAQNKIDGNEGNDDDALNLSPASKMKRSISEINPTYDEYRNLKKARDKREIIETTMADLPANRTIFLSCGMPTVLCQVIRCRVGPFQRIQHVARLQITMSLNVTTLKVNVMGLKDIIALTTKGVAEIVKGEGKDGSVEIRSVFVSSPPQQKVEMWIIILSVILGLLLVLFVIMGLVKAGFFQRKMKEELEALKNEASKHKTEPQDDLEDEEHAEEDLKQDPEDFSIEHTVT